MRHATKAFCLLAVVTSLMLAPATAQGQPACVIDSTHFWTYTIQNPEYLSYQILVRDQFLPTYRPIQVMENWKFLNWVMKNESPVRDTLNHFVWYWVQPQIPVGLDVEIDNQFGRYMIYVEELEFMLVPAFKNPPPDVPEYPNLSHYLCYRAHGFPPPTEDFWFEDEWRDDWLPVYEMEYFCAPCWKEFEGKEFAPMDTVTHLAVFKIDPYSEVFYPYVKDQFLHRPYQVQQRGYEEYLFVPSVKGELPTPARQETWGRLKTLYR
jgi:hypothetical protein